MRDWKRWIGQMVNERLRWQSNEHISTHSDVGALFRKQIKLSNNWRRIILIIQSTCQMVFELFQYILFFCKSVKKALGDVLNPVCQNTKMIYNSCKLESFLYLLKHLIWITWMVENTKHQLCLNYYNISVWSSGYSVVPNCSSFFSRQ